jgi:hypothetical protein
MNRNLVRLAGPCLGAGCGVATMVMVNGLWGLTLGGAVFFGCAAVSDWIWRRKATREEIRQDLEDRVRNTLP